MKRYLSFDNNFYQRREFPHGYAAVKSSAFQEDVLGIDAEEAVTEPMD